MPLFSTAEIHRAHYSKKPFLGLLGVLLSSCYALGLQFVQAFASPKRLSQSNVPIVAIGNLTTGGTGKTPLTLALAKYIEAHDKTPLVLCRGYKAAQPQECLPVKSATQGDEAFLMQSRLTRGQVWTAKNRAVCIPKALQMTQADVVILDDAFQSLVTPRDWNIVLIDGDKGLGNGYLLPAGPLREPISALCRANVIVITRRENVPLKLQVEALLTQHGYKIPVVFVPIIPEGLFSPAQEKTLSLRELKNKSVALFSGLAQPEPFETMVVQSTGASVAQHWIFPDHHPYVANDLNEALQWQASHPERAVVTTRKDWVKLAMLPDSKLINWLVLDISPEVDWLQVLGPIQDHLDAHMVVNA